LKRFDEEMLKVKELLKLVVLKVLISGVKKCALCRKFMSYQT